MSSYLIVATYNHQAYSAFKSQDPSANGKHRQARSAAVALFGRRVIDSKGQVDPDRSRKGSFDKFFTFVDAFRYHEISEDVKKAEEKPDDNISLSKGEVISMRERIKASEPFGWVGIINDDKLNDLKSEIQWPDGPFCQVFDIQIIALQGRQTLKPPSDSLDILEQRGQAIYNDQTPKMWED